jgi:hypothetical protein
MLFRTLQHHLDQHAYVNRLITEWLALNYPDWDQHFEWLMEVLILISTETALD